MSEVVQSLENISAPVSKAKYRPYPAYRDSGIEWLGDVPVGWDITRFKFAVAISKNKAEGNGLDRPYLGLENIESWTGKLIESDLPIEPESIVNIFERNEVLFGKLRPYLAKVYLAEQPGVCSTELLVVRENQIKAHFLKYLFLSHNFINIVNSLTYGVKMPRASWELIGNLFTIVPLTSEQHSIATFLDEKTSKTDALIEKKERLIELLKEKRTALISQAVTKGLDPNAKMKNSRVEWLGEVPEGWDIRKLKFIAKLKSGESITSEEIEEVDEYPVFGGNGLRGYHSKYTHDGHFVLIGRQGALCGNINYGKNKFWASEHAVVATPCEKMATTWLGELLRVMNLNQYSVSAAQPGLAVDKIKELLCPYPPFIEQKLIAEFIENETTEIDALIQKVQSAIDKLKEYRTALISAAVTGKIDVHGFISREVACQ